MRVGILALQGAVGPHQEKLSALGVKSVQVRRPEELEGLSGIILPGGESTTMIHLLKLNELWGPLARFVRELPTWGVCAGTILLAKRVERPAQDSLDAMDIAVERNAFGRQLDSFIAEVTPTEARTDGTVEGVFIRAPRIRTVGHDVRVLFRWKEEPVMVEERHLLASTFHPELTGSTVLHRYFISKCQQA